MPNPTHFLIVQLLRWHFPLAVLFFVLGFVFLFMFESSRLKSVGAISIGISQIWILAATYIRGELRTNGGKLDRATQPIRFRVEFIFWCLFATSLTIMLLLYANGILNGSNG